MPNIIDGDAEAQTVDTDTDGTVDGIVTLDDSSLWIVDKPVLVKDTTLKITEGAQVQFLVKPA